MINPNHSKLHSWLLNVYIIFILKSDFREVKITGDIKPDGRSILLIPNHFSWWDGFFAWYLNKNLFKKQYHVMMLEHELAKRMFFTRVGAFSVNLNSKSVIESINFCSQVLNNPNNLLLMFPQGKLGSQHLNSVKFRKGIERILKQTPNTRVIFAVCLIDYFAHRRPSLTIALKEYLGSHSLIDIENDFNNHLKQSVINQDNLYNT
jgi:1-acyl-sn-glycerol-3-phosphate acyltransferase